MKQQTSEFEGAVYPTLQEPIGTPEGNATTWAVDDTLATLRNELQQRGIDCPSEAMDAARQKMLKAGYLSLPAGGAA